LVQKISQATFGIGQILSIDLILIRTMIEKTLIVRANEQYAVVHGTTVVGLRGALPALGMPQTFTPTTSDFE